MALRIALSGFVVLVVAMGIGRFAFTPQVPLMITAGQLTLTSAGLVAAMNYLGYLVGAWDAMRAHRFVETRLWLGITGAVALTLLSAAADNAVVHGLLRFVIGCMSGWSMVLIAAWTNERLGQLGKPGLSAAVFAGPGAGIALSGLLAVYIQASSLSAGAAWQIYGVLALVLIALVARYLPRAGQLHRPGSLFAQFVWPIFGAASVVGIAISIALRHTSSANRRLAIVLWLQGIGVLAAWLLPGIGGLLTGGLLVGGGFLCAVQLSLLYGRELAPDHTRYMAGLLTTGYAIGQLIGPVTSALSTWLTHRLEPALGLAGIALFAGGALVWNRQAERQQQLQ